jgi:predicted RNA-binding protein YlqC (UPF0109 family)
MAFSSEEFVVTFVQPIISKDDKITIMKVDKNFIDDTAFS